jgi:ABC-type phosphate/phosphonate transport system substrate-binding protein
MMSETIWLGAVAYDPKVVSIWEGMRRYFHEEVGLRVEVLLFLTYEAQIEALLSDGTAAPRIDIGWNTNLAYLQSMRWSDGRCTPIAMRDSDLGWRTNILAPSGGAVRSVGDLRGKTVAIGSRDSGHASILPVYFLAKEGLVEGRDYKALRLDTDVGKHGDTGRSEVDVLRAILDGRADAGAVGSPFWSAVREKKLAPEGAVSEVWTSPPYSHCMFTGRPGLDRAVQTRFAEALYGMQWENPAHRAVLEAEGLKRWLPAQLDGYASLEAACEAQGYFRGP